VNITQNNDAITVTVDGKSYVIGGEGNEISDRNSRGVYAEILKKTNKIVSDYFGAGQSGGAQRGELD
jgi:hypothetical protein